MCSIVSVAELYMRISEKTFLLTPQEAASPLLLALFTEGLHHFHFKLACLKDKKDEVALMILQFADWKKPFTAPLMLAPIKVDWDTYRCINDVAKSNHHNCQLVHEMLFGLSHYTYDGNLVKPRGSSFEKRIFFNILYKGSHGNCKSSLVNNSFFLEWNFNDMGHSKQDNQNVSFVVKSQ